MTDTYERFPEIYGQNDRLFLESGTMSHGTPVRVMVMGVLLMLAYLLVMLQILCLFRLMERRKLGIINYHGNYSGRCDSSFLYKIIEMDFSAYACYFWRTF
ncbi:MAG: hypothetical protein ACLUD0_02920 [Eubacterium ramulus]